MMAEAVANVDQRGYPDFTQPAANTNHPRDYVGSYAADIAGRVDVSLGEHGLVAEQNRLRLSLLADQGDRFAVLWRSHRDGKVADHVHSR